MQLKQILASLGRVAVTGHCISTVIEQSILSRCWGRRHYWRRTTQTIFYAACYKNGKMKKKLKHTMTSRLTPHRTAGIKSPYPFTIQCITRPNSTIALQSSWRPVDLGGRSLPWKNNCFFPAYKIDVFGDADPIVFT